VYVDGDPVNAVDPSGLAFISIDVTINIPGTNIGGTAGVQFGDGGIAVSAGAGGGAGGWISARSFGGEVSSGTSTQGGGCASPVVVGAAACGSYDSASGVGVGGGFGSGAGIYQSRTWKLGG
jgi:hypothetical protein